MIKKWFALLLTVVMLFSMVACSKQKNTSSNADTSKVSDISIATVLIRVPRVLMLTQVLVILLAQTPARILPVLPQQVRKALLQYNR